MRKKTVGVYRITNTVNGMFYIGGSIDITNRWKQHRNELRGGRHHNDKWQKAWKKYGEDAFSFEVVEETTQETLREREQAWIHETRCTEREIGYNLTDCVDSPNRGKRLSPETCRRMSEAGRGKPKPPCSEAHRAAIRASWELRRLTPVSAETKAKLSAARAGKPRPASFVEKMTGRKNTEETKKKMREATLKTIEEGRHGGHRFELGHQLSPEAKAKKLASLTATLAAKKTAS